jgi:hypothetical protein
MLALSDLLQKASLDPRQVVVMRHRPTEKALREELGWMAAERPELFNAFQSSHSPNAEATLKKAKHLVSLIGHEAGRAVFIGVYDVASFRSITVAEFEAMEPNRTLLDLGTRGPEGRAETLWFDLRATSTFAKLKGRLVVGWPTPERAWCRWASNSVFPIETIHEESILVRGMPPWQQLVVPFRRLAALPMSWRAALGQWRGIYLIFDTAQGKGYVGSAAGVDNLLGRWECYAKTGHGGNRQLRACNAGDLVFSVLQLVEPDRALADVIALEQSWKARLHTRDYGLNDN